VPRSPQGRPVLIQAGQSGRGRRFAARWGDLIFVIFPGLAFARQAYREIKDEVARVGRDPERVRIAPAMYCVVADTRAEAEAKATYIEGLAHPLDSLVLLSEVLNYDFARRDPDAPFSDAELAGITGLQALRDRVVRLSGKPNPTSRDFVRYSGRGTLAELPRFVGTPAEVAEGLEEWFSAPAADGFVLAATHIPGAYEDFVRLVVPELQRRGLFHREYAGATLRDNLALPRPPRGDWARP
jgi:alkanesulfonate monooxygenase SsuD/methylene tetrahydromethanopterin reductase-like flavin-dependent oxidoreductase (luciferase family)